MSRPVLIGLSGGMGSGKTTLADYLVAKHKFVKQPFAKPLKDMLHTFGLTEEHTGGSLKEQPLSMLEGRSPRHAMQTLGTEWGRGLIGPNIWINHWKRRLTHTFAKGYSVVTDDMRFPNEAQACSALGGTVVFVDRPLELRWEAETKHVSEMHNMKEFSDMILNNSHELKTSLAILDEIVANIQADGPHVA